MKKPKFLKLGASVAIMAITAATMPFLTTQSAQADTTNWQKGVSITSRSAEDFASNSFKQSVQNAKDMGATHISLVIPYYQSNFTSADIAPGWNTPSDETIGKAIDYIHSIGLKAVLKPHLELYGGEWRGLIQANDRDLWYAKYGAILNHLGDIGKAHGAEEIIIGSELIGMASSYRDFNNTARFESLISSLRSRYSGLLTYSANWGVGENYVNEFEYIKFWGSLDYIGISAYFEHWNDGSVPSLLASWKSIDDNQISKLQSTYNKPILFTEIGYKSIDNAHTQPWDSGKSGAYNAQEQVNDYEALFQYWNNRPYFTGLILWDWNSDPNYGGQGNTDYTPHNKPAENTIRHWFTTGPSQSPAPTPTPDGEWNGIATGAEQVSPGTNASFPVTISNTGQGSGLIADIEIYNSANVKVHQQFFENQNISNGTPANYTINWTPVETGVHTIKIGVFASNWGTNYYWNNSAHTFTVGNSSPNPPPNPNPNPQPNSFDTNIWWPSNGATVGGLQPFKAMVEGKSTSEYAMYWQVDGGNLNEMYNSDVDYPHKETLVDLSGWNWKGAGPYTVNFVSKDTSGNMISQKSTELNIYTESR